VLAVQPDIVWRGCVEHDADSAAFRDLDRIAQQCCFACEDFLGQHADGSRERQDIGIGRQSRRIAGGGRRFVDECHLGGYHAAAHCGIIVREGRELFAEAFAQANDKVRELV